MAPNRDLFQMELDLHGVSQRAERLAGALAVNALIDIGKRAEHARRCIGQQFRRAREVLEGVNHGHIQ